MIRRNSIVKHKHPDKSFYGRVIRVLDEGKVFWICCGLHFHITHVENLIETDYKGYVRENIFDRKAKPRFVPMTTLRNLKRRAKQYHGDSAFNTPLDYEFIIHD